MNDDLGAIDARLRDRARTTALPEAPESLRAFPGGLGEEPVMAHARRPFRPWYLLIPAAIVVVAGLAIAGGVPIVRIPAVVPSTGPTATPPAGYRRISAQGVQLDVPDGWVDATAWAPTNPGTRNVAYLIDGVEDCPGPEPTAAPAGTAATASCLADAGSAPNTLAFVVVEDLDPAAGPPPSAPSMTIGGYPAVSRLLTGSDGPSGTTWDVAGPGSSRYTLMATFPNGDGILRQPEIAAVIDSVRFAGSSNPAAVEPSATAPTAAAGWRHIDVPGVGLDVPDGWVDTTAWEPTDFYKRNVISLIDGVAACPGAEPTAAPMDPNRRPDCMGLAGDSSGTLGFGMMEWLNPLPIPMIYPIGTGASTTGPRETPSTTTIGGYPAQMSRSGSSTNWWIFGPHGHLYALMLGFPSEDAATRQPQVDAVLRSIRFTDWTAPPPPVIAGWYHFDAGIGVAFDYPTTWRVYYPAPYSYGGITLVSRPLSISDLGSGSPETPTGTMRVDFMFTPHPEPDWTTANTSVGGQTAIRTTEPTPLDLDAIATDEWTVRFGSPGVLRIKAWIHGPGADEFRQQLDRLIASMEVQPPPQPYGP